MILPKVGYWEMANKTQDYYSTDNPQYWPSPSDQQLNYEFNSRGYRDSEWPDDVTNCIWAVGDCFWAGFGLPIEKTTSARLQQQLGQRIIDVAVGGPSQQWIHDRALDILSEIKPNKMIVSWTLLDRLHSNTQQQQILDRKWQTFYNNVKDPSWPERIHRWEFVNLPDDVQRELEQTVGWEETNYLTDLEYIQSRTVSESLQLCVDQLLQCVDNLERAKNHTQLVHCFAPIKPKHQQWHPYIENRILSRHPQAQLIPAFSIGDLARDQQHYGPKTAEILSHQIYTVLNTSSN